MRGAGAPDGAAVTRPAAVAMRYHSSVRSHFGTSPARIPADMAHSGGHAVLVAGLRGGTPPGVLWDALIEAGHRPLAIGLPAGTSEQGRCYVTFHEEAEANSVCRRHGALRLFGRALQVTRLFGGGWGPDGEHADAASDDERPPRPALPLPARSAALPRRPAASPLALPGQAARPVPETGREHSVLIRGLRSGTHPGHIWDTLADQEAPMQGNFVHTGHAPGIFRHACFFQARHFP